MFLDKRGKNRGYCIDWGDEIDYQGEKKFLLNYAVKGRMFQKFYGMARYGTMSSGKKSMKYDDYQYNKGFLKVPTLH